MFKSFLSSQSMIWKSHFILGMPNRFCHGKNSVVKSSFWSSQSNMFWDSQNEIGFAKHS